MAHWKKLGLVYQRLAEDPGHWWATHMMAPTAVQIDSGRLRVYLGGWDRTGISRIAWIDVDAHDPLRMLGRSERPALDIGRPGCFDENGVFPAHACRMGEDIRLYYTGFQLGHKVRHYNFGGLAVSRDGDTFERVSEAPVLDRADEGLYVRAGQSILPEHGIFPTVYSAGSEWIETGGKLRPCYDVYYQESRDGLSYQPRGSCIVRHDPAVEHGLGRPQLVRLDGRRYVFYTRRILGMKYFLGCARESDGPGWQRCDDEIDLIHSERGFDSDMIYFPSVIQVPVTGRVFLFYSGNGFGHGGLGVAERVTG
jgi:hypothetical protein